MLAIKAILFIEMLLIAWVGVKKNPDIFSPVKIYVVFSTFFYLAIYFQEVRWETLLCFALLIQSIAVCLFIEGKRINAPVYVLKIDFSRLTSIVWLLSLPGIATMIYFVYDAGGILEYIASLALRVQAWKGRGLLVILVNTLPTLNLVYFSGIITGHKKGLSTLLLYFAHFIIFVMVGLLTGSRSYIGILLMGMYVIWSYMVRPQKVRYTILIAIFLIAFAGVLGAVRNNYGGEMNGGFLEGLFSGGKFENAQIAYGVNPLEIIFGASENVFLGGSTYLSLLTNFIPRDIYPDKLDTGGIVFTRIYTGDHWGGLSYLSPGAVAEAVMNFGVPFGVAFGVILNFMALLWGCVLYNNLLNKPPGGKLVNPLWVVAYFHAILAFARLSYGEFTDIFQSLILFNLLPLVFISIGLRLK